MDPTPQTGSSIATVINVFIGICIVSMQGIVWVAIRAERVRNRLAEQDQDRSGHQRLTLTGVHGALVDLKTYVYKDHDVNRREHSRVRQLFDNHNLRITLLERAAKLESIPYPDDDSV